MQKFKLQEKTKKTIIYTNKYIICNIPKVHKVLRDQLYQNLFDLNHNILRANVNNGSIRNKYQKEALVNLYTLDMILEIMLELNIVDKKRFIALVGALLEIKKMLQAWMENEKTKEIH